VPSEMVCILLTMRNLPEIAWAVAVRFWDGGARKWDREERFQTHCPTQTPAGRRKPSRGGADVVLGCLRYEIQRVGLSLVCPHPHDPRIYIRP
jgi:hypothetical protein